MSEILPIGYVPREERIRQQETARLQAEQARSERLVAQRAFFEWAGPELVRAGVRADVVIEMPHEIRIQKNKRAALEFKLSDNVEIIPLWKLATFTKYISDSDNHTTYQAVIYIDSKGSCLLDLPRDWISKDGIIEVHSRQRLYDVTPRPVGEVLALDLEAARAALVQRLADAK